MGRVYHELVIEKSSREENCVDTGDGGGLMQLFKNFRIKK